MTLIELIAAFTIMLILTLGILGMRAQSFEQRYLGPALVFWVLWMLLPLRNELRSGKVQPSLKAHAFRCERSVQGHLQL